jgi:hypothetical protein
MATLGAIRSSLESELQTFYGTGTQVLSELTANPPLPCVVFEPEEADFDVAMARGTDTWVFVVSVAVPAGNAEVGQVRLDPYVSGAGSLSVRQGIWNARTAFVAAGFDAHISAMTSYGGQLEIVGKDHIGATLRLIVHTRGTE